MEMKSAGYIKLHRDIQNHWVWQDAKYLKWWITILLNVNHQTTTFPVNSILHQCNPGQSFRSVESWAGLFGCAKSTAIKFFKMLESDEMIVREIVGKGNRRKHLLTLVNWARYQISQPEIKLKTIPKENRKLNRNVPPNKNGKNEKNEKNKHIAIPFEKFWNLYNKKIGDRTKCEKKWGNLKDEERNQIMSILPDWLSQFTDKQFQPYPATFLNQKRWEDEINSKSKSNATNNAKPIEPRSSFEGYDAYDAYGAVKEAMDAQ